MPGSGPLAVERRGDALLVGFNRPEKRNAIDRAVVDALHEVLTDAARDRCILVLHSTTPGVFVSGADINELLVRDADDAFLGHNIRLFERIEAHRWPTIAAVDGPALGGGCELAMACDLRIASSRARFAQPELNLGILAGAGANCHSTKNSSETAGSEWSVINTICTHPPARWRHSLQRLWRLRNFSIR